MSAEQTEILEGIRQKILRVKDRLAEQQEENMRLKNQNDKLQKDVQEKQELIDELKEKNQKLALVKGIMDDGDGNQDAKIQINRIVREIDKCIALLNR